MTSRNLNIMGRSVSLTTLVTGAVLGTAALWAYWPTLAAMAHKWTKEPEYSHGWLVPAFAVVLLWFRRTQLANVTYQPNWWGVPLVLLALALRLGATLYYFEYLDAFSLIPLLAGLALLLGGWPALRWSWPAILFLMFMIPLPWRLQVALAHPLQRIATIITTYVMQTIGLPALAEGNVIVINDIRIGVVEACSGLSMLLVFFALSTAVAILINRPLLDKLVIFFSAVPIAIAANVIRITVTGLLHVWLTGTAADAWFKANIDAGGIADTVFHKWAGWLMMLVALAIMWLELKLLSWLLLEPEAVPHSGPMAPVPSVRTGASSKPGMPPFVRGGARLRK